MAVPAPAQYTAMLDAALDAGYAYAAINVTSSQTLNAVVRAGRRPHRPLPASRERVDRGEPPLFNSHMFDGSTLALEVPDRAGDGFLDRETRVHLLTQAAMSML